MLTEHPSQYENVLDMGAYSSRIRHILGRVDYVHGPFPSIEKWRRRQLEELVEEPPRSLSFQISIQQLPFV